MPEVLGAPYDVLEMLKRCGRNRGRYERLKPDSYQQKNSKNDNPDHQDIL